MSVVLLPFEKKYMDYLLVESGLEEETAHGYRRELTKFWMWLEHGGLELAPEQVEIRHIRRYLSYLKNELGNSPVTRNGKLSALKSYFNFLVIIEVIEEEENPLKYIRRAKEAERLPVYLTLEEAEALLEASSVNSMNPERDYAIMRFFLQTGCRLGELVKVKFYDVDLEEKSALIRGKGRRERLLPLTPNTCRAIAEYLPLRKPAGEEVEELFLSNRGRGLSSAAVSRIFKRACKQAGLLNPKLSVMKLRHTCLTILLNEGVDLVVLRDIAGHKKLSTTRIYTHITQKKLKEAVKKHPLEKQEG